MRIFQLMNPLVLIRMRVIPSLMARALVYCALTGFVWAAKIATADVAINPTAPRTSAEVIPDWVLSSTQRSQNLDLSGDIVIEKDSSGENCITFRAAKKARKAYYHKSRARGDFRANRSNIKTATCGASLTRKLNFRVFASNALNDGKSVSVRMLVPNSLRSSRKIEVSQMQWELISPSGTVIGGLGDSRFTKSRWIQDPENPEGYALYLVAEIKQSRGLKSDPGATDRGTGKIASAEALKRFNPGQFNGRFLSLSPVSNAPKLKWTRETPKRSANLFLQVVPELSKFAEGLVCIRPIYKVSDSRGYLYFNGSGSPAFNDLKIDPATVKSPRKCETTQVQTLFWVALDTASETVSGGELSLSVRQTGRSQTFDLTQSNIAVRRGKTIVGTASRWASVEGTSAAIVKYDTQPKTTVRPKRKSITVVYEPTYESLSKEQRDAFVDKLSVNGQLVKDFVPFVADGSGALVIDWAAMSSIGAPLSITLKCTADPCPAPISEPATTALINSSIEGRENILTIEWGAVSSPAPSVASTSTANTHLIFEPVIAFGALKTPLTTCVGRLHSGDFVSEPFKLAGQGRQKMQEPQLPGQLTPDSVVTVRYSESRVGSKCPLAGLESSPMTVSELLAAASSGPVIHELKTNSHLYVGYLSLTGPDTRHSIARWRETLEFMDAIYQLGRANAQWVDGLMYGATERSGRIDVRLSSPNNFAESLGSKDVYVEVAEGMQYNQKISNGFFDENLQAMVAKVDNARVNMVYFDDTTRSCSDYRDEIDRFASPMKVGRAIVIAALAVADYTGQNSVRALGGNLAFVCEESENITVYAFNQRERARNLDWKKALDAIYDDLNQKWKN